MLKIALLGQKGSGRAFFQKLLEDAGVKIAKSYTNREKRDENDNMHHFINNIDKFDNRLLETEHDGYIYFYTKEELKNADVIPIDPQNLKALCEMFPGTAFRFIEIMASDKDRLAHAVANADDKLTAEADFIAACEEECEAFETFAKAVKSRELGIDNLAFGSMVVNDFTSESDIYTWVFHVQCQIRQFKRMLKICRELNQSGLIETGELPNSYSIKFNEKDAPRTVVPDMLAEFVLLNAQSMYPIISMWLQLEKNSFDD